MPNLGLVATQGSTCASLHYAVDFDLNSKPSARIIPHLASRYQLEIDIALSTALEALSNILEKLVASNAPFADDEDVEDDAAQISESDNDTNPSNSTIKYRVTELALPSLPVLPTIRHNDRPCGTSTLFCCCC